MITSWIIKNKSWKISRVSKVGAKMITKIKVISTAEKDLETGTDGIKSSHRLIKNLLELLKGIM